jgi:hypothetical protein
MNNFEKDCDFLSEEQMKNMKTRQLLAHLRTTYRWGEYYWVSSDCAAKAAYQSRIKAELATREHIPNKIESKRIRIARKKKGN